MARVYEPAQVIPEHTSEHTEKPSDPFIMPTLPSEYGIDSYMGVRQTFMSPERAPTINFQKQTTLRKKGTFIKQNTLKEPQTASLNKQGTLRLKVQATDEIR